MSGAIYLRPSQRPDRYPNGGDEAYWIARISDKLEEDLGARGIACVKDRAGSAFEGCGLCLYLCSHSAPEEVAAKIKGAQVSYYEYSPSGRRAAEIFTRHVKSAYPQPDLVDMAPTAARKEPSESKAPALLIQLGYHDNPQDEAWLVNSAGEIAASLAAAAADFMGVEP